MVAKRIKRARNQARREAFMAEHRKTGLDAQRKDRERQSRNRYSEWEEKHNTKHSSKKPDADCPWCNDIAKALKRRDAVLSKAVENQAS